MADDAARSLQYEYKANSNLVLQVRKEAFCPTLRFKSFTNHITIRPIYVLSNEELEMRQQEKFFRLLTIFQGQRWATKVRRENFCLNQLSIKDLQVLKY
jgi:hypothetical protein